MAFGASDVDDPPNAEPRPTASHVAQESELFDWLAKNAQVGNGVSLTLTSGIRGLVADQDVEPGQILLEVPGDRCLWCNRDGVVSVSLFFTAQSLRLSPLGECWRHAVSYLPVRPVGCELRYLSDSPFWVRAGELLLGIAKWLHGCSSHAIAGEGQALARAAGRAPISDACCVLRPAKGATFRPAHEGQVPPRHQSCLARTYGVLE